jgi:VWFA-related protein
MAALKCVLAVALAGAVFADVASAQAGPKTSTSETIARPRRGSENAPAPDLPPVESELNKRKREQPDLPVDVPTFRADVTTVTVDVAVLDNQGRFIPNIPAGNFRVLEDNVPQKISSFEMGEAPMTVAMVIEWSGLFQQYWSETWYQTLTASYGFLETLKPEDYVAIVAYDMRPEILSDFSTDKRAAYEAMQRLRIAAYSETNLYDAIVDTAERMSEIEGRKAIVLIASGLDTFSKLNFGETRRRLQMAGVPIYAVGLMQALREWYDSRGYLGPIARLDFLQADNQMRTFAAETGGMSFFPRFYGEFPTIFANISQSLRNQYSVTYLPTNQAKDGSFRRIKVELVNPATNERLRIVNEKGKSIKYQVLAKAGYTAPRPVE